VLAFDRTTYHSETAPGRVSLTGSLIPDRHHDLPVIHRVGANTHGQLALVGSIADGVDVAGVDVFESMHTLRLRNLGLPKTVFGPVAG
jgi:hypothetical protein